MNKCNKCLNKKICKACWNKHLLFLNFYEKTMPCSKFDMKKKTKPHSGFEYLYNSFKYINQIDDSLDNIEYYLFELFSSNEI